MINYIFIISKNIIIKRLNILKKYNDNTNNILIESINNIDTIKSNIGDNICQDDYELSDNYCIKKETIKAKKK